MPSRRSLIHDLLGGSGVTNGLALDTVAMSASGVIGPALAGGLIVLADVAAACSVEAVKPLVDRGKAQLRTLLQELRTKDPKLAGTYLQMIGRGGDRASMVFREDRTLIAYNQISPHLGAVGTWKTRLDEETQRTIVDRYADWYADVCGNVAE